MLRDIFKSVGDIEIYGLISMIIFVICFTLLTIHAVSLKRKDVADFSRMPLDDFSDESKEL